MNQNFYENGNLPAAKSPSIRAYEYFTAIRRYDANGAGPTSFLKFDGATAPKSRPSIGSTKTGPLTHCLGATKKMIPGCIILGADFEGFFIKMNILRAGCLFF